MSALSPAASTSRSNRSISQNLGEQLGADAFAVVHSEDQRSPIGVHEEAMASVTTSLAKARSLQR
jgi:hypothetical protein